jgi:hypothetical protein
MVRLLFVVTMVAAWGFACFYVFVHESLLWNLGQRPPFYVPDFRLEEVRGGEPFRLQDAHGRPLIILAFSTLSPEVGQFLDAAAEVVEKGREKGVVFAAVNFQQIDRDKLVEHLERGDYPFPVYDGFTTEFELQALCQKVPRLFVLDRRQRLLGMLDVPDAKRLESLAAKAADDGSREARLPLSRVELPNPPPDGPPAWERLGREASTMLARGEIDELERWAARLRAEKTRFPDGTQMLGAFYDGLGLQAWRGVIEDGPSRYAKRVQLIEAWIAAKPDSITPRVALVKAYLYWAWRARGAGEVQVEPKEWRERLQKAWDAAQEAKKLAQKDPELWRAQLGVALAMQKELPEFDGLIGEAQAVDPNNERYLESKVTFLTQRWFGDAGDWEAFAAKAAADRNDPALLAQLIDSETDFYGGELFNVTRVEWPKLRESLLALNTRYPRSLYRLNRFARYACMAGDKDTAKRLMSIIGLRYREDAWKSRHRFDACVDWTIGREPKPSQVPDYDKAEVLNRLELAKGRLKKLSSAPKR